MSMRVISFAWREHVMQRLHDNQLEQSTQIESIRRSLLYKLPTVECVHCTLKILELDVVKLPCEHYHCQDCLRSKKQEQERREDTLSPDIRTVWGKLKGLILCSRCFTPAVLEDKCVFEEGFARKVVSLTYRTKLVVLRDLTQLLGRSVRTVEVFENERRTLFSFYAAKRLLPTDHRGHWSTEGGDKIGDTVEQRDRHFLLPNSRFVWLCEWTIDNAREELAPRAPPTPSSAASAGARVDPDGWQYAFNWPTTGVFSANAKWSPTGGALHFVRRRRWVRVQLSLTQDVVDLAAIKPQSAPRLPGSQQ